MIGEIISGILGVAFLVGAVMQFQCKGPVWSTEYVASSPKERKKLRNRQEYYWSAVACLWIGIMFLLTLVYTLTELEGFLYAVFILAGFLFIHILYGIYRGVKKSSQKQNRQKKNQ